jgi:hypothetical protein
MTTVERMNEHETQAQLQELFLEKLNEFIQSYLPSIQSHLSNPPGRNWQEQLLALPRDWQCFAYPRGRLPTPTPDADPLRPMDLFQWMDLIVILPKPALEGLPILPAWLNKPKPATRRDPDTAHTTYIPGKRQRSPEHHRKVGVRDIPADAFVELFESVTRISGNGLDPIRLGFKDYHNTPDPFSQWLDDPKWDFDRRKANDREYQLLQICFELSNMENPPQEHLFPILFNLRAGKRYVLKVDSRQLTAPAPMQFLCYEPRDNIHPVFRHRPGTNKSNAIDRRPDLLILQSFDKQLRIYLREPEARPNPAHLPVHPRTRALIQDAWDLHHQLLSARKSPCPPRNHPPSSPAPR